MHINSNLLKLIPKQAFDELKPFTIFRAQCHGLLTLKMHDIFYDKL